MADILDYVFLFWVFVAGGCYIVGFIYEKHLENEARLALKKKKKETKVDHWSPSYNSTSSTNWRPESNSSHQYNASYSSSTIGQQQQPLYSYQQPQSSSSNNYQDSNKLVDCNQQQQPQYSPAYEETRVGGPTSSSYGLESSIQPAAGHKLERSYSHHYNYEPQHWNHEVQSTNLDTSSIPTASGFNSDCVEWVNSILYLFYSQAEKYGPIIMESLYRSLNEKLANILSSSDEYGHLVIEFTGFNQQMSTRPELTNIRTENESEKSVSAVCKIYNKRIMFDVNIQRSRRATSQLVGATNLTAATTGIANEQQQQVVQYELTLENLEGKLKSVAILNDKLIIVQFMEKPDTKILLRRKYNTPASDINQIINEDSLVNLVLQTLTQIVVDLYFGDDADFPHYLKQHTSGYRNKLNILKGSANEIKRQIKHDFFGALSSSADKERKIFIKIIKAKNINYNQNVTCLLELDTPYQQALSSTKQASSNPHWDEHFLFNITDKSTELSIELWDSVSLPKDNNSPSATAATTTTSGSSFGSLKRSAKLLSGGDQSKNKWSKQEVIGNGGKFLGLAKVNIDELRRNPVQKVNLALQAKNLTSSNATNDSATITDLSNSVGGELQVELMFLEHSTSGHSNSGVNTQSGGIHKSNSLSSISYQQGDVVSVDRKLTPSGYVITTTTITKPKDRLLKREQSNSRLDRLSVRNQSPISSTEVSELDTNLDAISSQIGDLRSVSPNELDQQSRTRQQGDGESDRRPHRSRSRSRSFLKAIKKRFSLSRTRSRSVGESSPVPGRRGSQSVLGGGGGTNLDAVSIESRSRASSEASMLGAGRAKSVPASRDPSEVPTIVINKSRLSDTASAFTFTHPKSQLVIEVKEPGPLSPDGNGNQQRGQLKYYAIPDEMAHKSKWRRKGTKLHLFNEHQFVASHLAGSSTCHLCGRVFSRRPGKQGYKCRNCHLLSHKQCHVKVDHNCPYASGDGLKLEFIDAEPPARLMEMAQRSSGSDSMRQSSDSLPSRQHINKPSRISVKSISMEVDDR